MNAIRRSIVPAGLGMALFLLIVLGTPLLARAQSGEGDRFVYLPLVLRNWPLPTWHAGCPDCPRLVDDITARSMAIDEAGHPHAAFGGDSLYHAWHDGTQWQIEVADPSPGVGRYASLAIGDDGGLHAAYYDANNGCLKYAHSSGSTWISETVDCSYDGVGWYTSLALDGDGHPHVSYRDYARDALKYAGWDGTQWLVEDIKVSHTGDSHLVGVHNSLVIDSSGRPHVLYSSAGWGGTPYHLDHAWRDGGTWQIETVERQACCYVNSLAIDGSDRLHVVYQTFEDDGNTYSIRYAYHDVGGVGVRAASWQTQAVVTHDNDLFGISLALDGNGYPRIAHYDAGKKDLRYIWLGP